MLHASKKQIDELIEARRNYQTAYEIAHYGEIINGEVTECLLPEDLTKLSRLVGVPVRTKRDDYGTRFEVDYNGCIFFWYEKYEKEVA